MAKAQASRLVMEVAPSKLGSMVRHKVLRILDTIKEEEREVMENFSSLKRTSSSCLVRELEKSFSVHGHEWPRPSPSSSFS